MAASSYDEALRRLLAHEGGYTNHPSDPGGPTNFGITIAVYRQRRKPDATAADIRAMTVDEAKAIYRAQYWDALRCDELPAGVDYAVFDYGVNSGVGRSGKVLRRVLGLTDASSAITDEVIASCRRANPKNLVTAICDERLSFLKQLKTWPAFGAGWSRRVAEVRRVALSMSGAPAPQISSSTIAKGGATAVVVAAGAAASQAHQPTSALLIFILIAGAALAIASFLLWRWRQREQAQE